VHLCSFGTEKIDGGSDSGRGDVSPQPGRVGGAVGASTIELDAGSAQQSAMIRGGVGAQIRHLMVSRVDVHVHLLSARVGVVMKTYWRLNGESFKLERNERASPLIARAISAQAPQQGNGRAPRPASAHGPWRVRTPTTVSIQTAQRPHKDTPGRGDTGQHLMRSLTARNCRGDTRGSFIDSDASTSPLQPDSQSTLSLGSGHCSLRSPGADVATQLIRTRPAVSGRAELGCDRTRRKAES